MQGRQILRARRNLYGDVGGHVPILPIELYYSFSLSGRTNQYPEIRVALRERRYLRLERA